MKEITTIQPKEVTSVDNLISQALTSNASIEVMERFFALKERAMAIDAKSAFDEAMATAQGKFPIIQKKTEGGRTQGGQVAYKYAPIEAIVSQVQKILKENGLSYSFKTEISVDKVKVACIAKHKLGHSELSEMELPFGTKTNVMSAPQVVVATVTFAKRYTFCNVFGITVGGEDTDASKASVSNSNKPTNIKSHIMSLLKTLGVDITNKELVVKEIKKMTKLDANDENNLPEIQDLLEILVSEIPKK